LGNEYSASKVIEGSITERNAFHHFDFAINPFVIIIFQRIFHVIDVFVDCLDGGFHIVGNAVLFIRQGFLQELKVFDLMFTEITLFTQF